VLQFTIWQLYHWTWTCKKSSRFPIGLSQKSELPRINLDVYPQTGEFHPSDGGARCPPLCPTNHQWKEQSGGDAPSATSPPFADQQFRYIPKQSECYRRSRTGTRRRSFQWWWYSSSPLPILSRSNLPWNRVCLFHNCNAESTGRDWR